MARYVISSRLAGGSQRGSTARAIATAATAVSSPPVGIGIGYAAGTRTLNWLTTQVVRETKVLEIPFGANATGLDR
jgi:hypothetical protein